MSETLDGINALISQSPQPYNDNNLPGAEHNTASSSKREGDCSNILTTLPNLGSQASSSESNSAQRLTSSFLQAGQLLSKNNAIDNSN